ncbi:Uncharacterised protein [Bordetella pertussis]|nr:Uncharacterised protein [Bordetella pertussis]
MKPGRSRTSDCGCPWAGMGSLRRQMGGPPPAPP